MSANGTTNENRTMKYYIYKLQGEEPITLDKRTEVTQEQYRSAQNETKNVDMKTEILERTINGKVKARHLGIKYL